MYLHDTVGPHLYSGPMSRAEDFDKIRLSLGGSLIGATDRGVVALGDSLELLRSIPDGSVSLVVTDPPYHSTQKDNIYGDKAFKKDAEYLNWMRRYAAEFRRILRPNGAAYVFCAPSMSAQLEVMFSEYLKPLNHITWTKPNDPGFDGWKGKMNKESLRRWYPHTERILFMEQAAVGQERRSTLAQLLREAREAAGISGHELTERTGAYGRVNHGGAVSNWETGRNIPSREQYGAVQAVLGEHGVHLPAYEDAVRPFQMAAGLEYTDVWNFPSVRPYRGKHPAEKPLEMLLHMIEATSYDGDIVLDCFGGSGATAVAALQLNRRAIVMEIESQWAERALERMEVADEVAPHETIAHRRSQRLEDKKKKNAVADADLSLFDTQSL